MAKQGVLGYVVCLIPAPRSHKRVEGILTGMWMLACVNLAKGDSKARTKPLCSWNFPRFILTSSVSCFSFKLQKHLVFKFRVVLWL